MFAYLSSRSEPARVSVDQRDVLLPELIAPVIYFSVCCRLDQTSTVKFRFPAARLANCCENHRVCECGFLRVCLSFCLSACASVLGALKVISGLNAASRLRRGCVEAAERRQAGDRPTDTD